MRWFFLSLACAFFTATTAALSKGILKKYNVFFAGWARFLFSLPIFVALLYTFRPHFSFEPGFWKIVIVLLPFEVSAFLLFLKALKISPLSLTFPFLGLTPVFTIFFSRFLLGEKVSPIGIAGIAIIALGTYLLNINHVKEGFLAPLKNIYREKGSLLMVIVALTYGATSVLGKKALLLSGPLSFAAVYYGIFFLIFTPLALAEQRKVKVKFEKRDAFLFLGLGVSFAAAMLFHFNAVVLTNVSYMVSVKRLSLVISVLYGGIIFHEKGIGSRMLGSAVILCGVLLLSLAH